MGAAKITFRIAGAVALLLGTGGLPGLFGIRALSATSSSVRPARAWGLAGHTIIGFALLLLIFMHAWSSMKLPGIHGTSSAGLWIATVALLFLEMQAAMGSSLLRLSAHGPIGVRHLHLGLAGILSVLAGVHVVLSGLSKEMK